MALIERFKGTIFAFLNKGQKRTVLARKNIIASFGLKAIGLAISFIKVPIILSYLDVEKYGVWLTIASIVNWVHHFDLGIGHGLRNKFAVALANNDTERAKHLVSTAYFYITLIFSCLSIVLIPTILILDWQKILNVESISNRELSLSVLIVFIMFVMRFILNLITMLLKADQRPALADSFLPVGNILALALVFILTNFSEDSLFLACMAIAAPPVVVIFFANLALFNRRYSAYKPRWNNVSKVYFHDIFSLGIKFFLIQLAGLIMFSSTNIILTQVVNPEEVTLYNVARQYYSLPFMFFGIILTPFWSAITDAHARNDFRWIKRTMRFLFKVGLGLSSGLIVLFVVSDFAIDWWLKGKVQIPVDLSVAMILLNLILLLFAPYSSFINGVGKLNLGLRVVVVKSIVFIPVAILLTQQFAATGLVISLILVNSLPSAVFEKLQYYKIINKKASGIWNR